MSTKPSNQEPKHVVVIGAGPAGLSAARVLTQAGIPTTVIEASSYIGGLCRSLSLWGQKVDLGPHRFFTQDEAVERFWREENGEDICLVRRQTRIFYNGRYFAYPLSPFDTLSKLNLLELVRCVLSYGWTQCRGRRSEVARNFEEWVTQRFGRRLFEMFFKSYTEKVWGLPCTEIDAQWSAQRIQALSLGRVLREAFSRGTDGKVRTLIGEFSYPKFGAGSFYEKLAERVLEKSGVLLREEKVRRVLLEGGAVSGVELVSGRRIEADCIVSTMPIGDLIRALPDVPGAVLEAAGRLSYRNSLFVYLEVESEDLFPDNWIYVHSPDVKVGRITNFRNWSPAICGDSSRTILCGEYWASSGDALWSASGQALGELARAELVKIGILKPSMSCERIHVEKVERSYPVYHRGYEGDLSPIVSYLREVGGLFPIGRNGTFKYNNQDHSILMGLKAAHSILSGATADLWGINQTSQYQEEVVAASRA